VADFNLHIPANALVGVTLLALLTAQSRFATAGHWYSAGRPVRLALSGTLAAVVLALFVDGWRRGGETYWLARADNESIFSPAKAGLLEKAFACEPENFQTAYDIGESMRMRSFQGGDDFATLAQQAIAWYAKDIRLDPLDGYAFMRTGMCLDWLGQSGEAVKYYQQAEPLDPNGYFMVANIGWHFVQIGDFAMAREYFMRSMGLSNVSPFARNYLKICEDKLIEEASGRPMLPFNY
jgi:tetratricopeptide (TPR) repeat protein